MALSTETAGLIFPVILSSGSSQLTSGLNSIKASIKIILAWPTKTRYFNGGFGSRIEEALEMPNDNVLITLVRRFVIDALNTWERRIELISMEITRPLPEKLSINLVYRVKDLSVEDSLFYEFYI